MSAFRVYHVSPMELNQVIAVVDKAPFEEQRKNLFKQALHDGLYATHESFLSNPLLVTIVLITFDDASRVPDNLTGFYSAAFDALFGRHDWSKGIFVRQHKTKLEKPIFERIFTYLCYLSYFYSDYTFEKDKIVGLIGQALQHAGVDVSASDYLDDCVLAVCLLQIDEPKVIFVHRSFQEYFTAKYVSQYSGPKLPAVLEWIASKAHIDNTFLMVTQLNRESVVRNWAIQKAKNIHDKWSNLLCGGDPIAVIAEAGITEIMFDVQTGEIDVISISWQRGFTLISAIVLAGQGNPIGIHGVSISTKIYAGGAYAKLPDQTRRRIAKNAEGEFASIHIDHKAVGDYPGVDFAALAKDVIEHVGLSLDSMEGFILERDKFAEMIDAVLPF